MLARRLKQLRQAKGYTLDELAAATGGLITKQAISKYELGKSNPSPAILTKLADVLGVKGSDLLFEPDYQIQLIAFRRSPRMSTTAREGVEARVVLQFEDRLRLQTLLGIQTETLPVRAIAVNSMDGAEAAAERVRESWRLGDAPISNLTGLLEDQSVHVLTTGASDGFDGLSAIAVDPQTSQTWSAAVVTSDGMPGDRQRFNLAHELGHLCMAPMSSMDEEKAAHRFAGAFLAPAEAMRRELGPRRQSVYLEELATLKERFGISVGALTYRALDAGIITASYHQHLWRRLTQLGYRKQEPVAVPTEKSTWLTQATLRAAGEGLIDRAEAERLLGHPLPPDDDLVAQTRKAVRKLSPADRERLLEAQAEKVAKLYEKGGPLDLDGLEGDL